MASICFYFQVHQPLRLRRFSIFDRGHDYFDDDANRSILRKVATKCYLPANALLNELIRRHSGQFRVAFVEDRVGRQVDAVGPGRRDVRTVADVLPEALGRPLPINVNGAIPTILLEIGFPVTSMKSVSILARTAGLLAHLQEESDRSIGFILSHAAAQAISYDGEKK